MFDKPLLQRLVQLKADYKQRIIQNVDMYVTVPECECLSMNGGGGGKEKRLWVALAFQFQTSHLVDTTMMMMNLKRFIQSSTLNRILSRSVLHLPLCVAGARVIATI